MDRFPSLREAWSSLPELLRVGLVGAGFDAPDVFRLAWDGSATEAGELASACGGVVGDVSALISLWNLCELPARALAGRAADFALPDAVVAVEKAAQKREQDREQAMPEPKRPHVRSCTDSRWPVMLRSNLEHEGDPRARAKAEAASRHKALLALRTLVVEAGLPITKVLGGGHPTQKLSWSVSDRAHAFVPLQSGSHHGKRQHSTFPSHMDTHGLLTCPLC